MTAAAVVLFFLAGSARAQDASSATAVSSDTTVAASTAPAVAVSSAPAAPPADAGPERVILVKLHREASDWQPVSLKAGGDARKSRTFLSRQLENKRVKGKAVWRGRTVSVSAKARVYKVKGDRMLVVSLFPKGKDLGELHLELRFLISEGYLDSVKVAAVRCRALSARGLDSYELSAKGIDYSEDFPGSGKLTLSAMNSKPGRSALNAGELSRAEFGSAELGLVDAGFSVRGVVAGK